jgi:adenine deaminase
MDRESSSVPCPGSWDDTPPLDRVALIEAAAGRRELDLVLQGVRVIDVFTGRAVQGDIGIFSGRIAHISGPDEPPLTGRINLRREGFWAIPGLIDTHVHIESSMITPARYAEVVLVHGTTTVVVDPHELANVLGLQGVRYMLEASKGIPLRVLVMAPSCVPSAPAVETSGAEFDRAEIAQMLTWPRVIGLAEVMDYPGVIRCDGRMMRELDAADAAGALVQGHAPGVRGRDLSAYVSAGIESDHETRLPQDALAKLRAGLYLEVRESSLSPNAKPLAEALRGLGYLPTVTLCTDDVVPEDLLRHGHLDHVVRRLIQEGLDPLDVIRFPTLNAATRLRRRDLGALSPGRIADIVLLSDLHQVTVHEVYRAGHLVASDGHCVVDCNPIPTDLIRQVESAQTIHLPENLSADIFRPRLPEHPSGRARIRVIDFHGRRAPIRTTYGTLDVNVHNGVIEIPGPTSPHLCILAVVERHGRSGRTACAIIRGFGPRSGALASSISHDAHNLTVVGTDPDDMLIACRAVAECGGGLALVRSRQIIARISLPIAGLISPHPVDTVAQEMAQFRKACENAGMSGDCAFTGVFSLTLAVSPEGKLSNLGLVDVNRQKLLPLAIET